MPEKQNVEWKAITVQKKQTDKSVFTETLQKNKNNS